MPNALFGVLDHTDGNAVIFHCALVRRGASEMPFDL